jgi:hypothetical protein
MPVTLTVLESIAVELLDRLAAMVDSDDYQTAVTSVLRLPRNGGEYTPEHLQIVMRQGDDEIDDEQSYPGNPPAIAHRQTFNLRCHVMTSKRDTDPVEATINTFAADVIKCITAPATWYQFDGKAINARIGPVEPINEDGGPDGFNLPISILYRVDENNPYNARP